MHFLIGHPILICDLQDAPKASLLESIKMVDGYGCHFQSFAGIGSQRNDDGVEQLYPGLEGDGVHAPKWLEASHDHCCTSWSVLPSAEMTQPR